MAYTLQLVLRCLLANMYRSCIVLCVVCFYRNSAADICDLKIIKDVAEAKSFVTAPGPQYSKRTTNARTLAKHNDQSIAQKAHDRSIALFQHSASDILVTNARNTVSSKETNVAQGFSAATVANPKKSSGKAATSRASNSKKSQSSNVAVDSRSSPYKKQQLNGFMQNRHPVGASRMKGYMDSARMNGCSPNDLTACVQAMAVSDEMVRSNDCFPDTNHRHLSSRKRTTSGMAGIKHVLVIVKKYF